MGLEAQERDTTAPVTTGSDHALNGIWNKSTPVSDSTAPKPSDTTVAPNTVADAKGSSDTKSPSPSTIANETSAPVFTDSDGTPLPEAQLERLKYTDTTEKPTRELAAMTLPRFPAVERTDVTQVSDKSKPSARPRPTADDLSRVAHKAVGSNKYGNKVPSTAAELKNMDVPQNLKCASTSSEWLVEIGMMTNRDYKVRVADMIDLLPEKGFKKVPLKGDLDLSKFPDGPIGFITGRGNYEDGSNHIGFIEKRNGELRIIHNNFETGRVVDQDIKQKFYTADGKPAYRDMSIFIFPRR